MLWSVFFKYIFGILMCINIIALAEDTTETTETTEISTTSLRSLRLPNTTYPLHYRLYLNSSIHVGDFEYWGKVEIDIKVRETTDEIVLHAKELSDFVVRVRDLQSKELRDDIDYSYYTEAHFLIIHTTAYEKAFIAEQQLRIEIKFKGVMQSKAQGIYWLNYTLDSNETMYLAATQFEPTRARLAFPCYDEPALKANFSLIITHSSTYEVIANMPVLAKQKQSNEFVTTTFKTTPVISTYLIAFVLYKNFDFISKTHRNVEQRVFTLVSAKNKGEHALENAVRTVATIEEYFGIKYALKKLDHIALNKNYGAAMENWGLITYDDKDVLVSVNDTVAKIKETLMFIHEITHQWFGNLVSPEWWTYAWLNEGFATYFSYVLTDKMYPQYKVTDEFLTAVTDVAYSSSQIIVRPISQYVESEQDIRGIFDIISYLKAACVIKMFHHAFKEKTFMKGLNIYLQNHQYSYANEMDLFSALQAAISQDAELKNKPWANSISDIMLSWTHSKSIPIVSVIHNKNNTITLKQTSSGSQLQNLWWIPINFATRSSPDFANTGVDYFMPPIPTVTIDLKDFGIILKTGDWVIANKQQTCFYHVQYDRENMLAIADQLYKNHTKIHAIDRGAVFRDLSPLIENNLLEAMDVVFELLKYLEFEQDLIPWHYVGDSILLLERYLYGTPSHTMYKKFIRRLVTPIFQKLHRKPLHKDVSRIETYTSENVMKIACMTDLKECLTYVRNITFDFLMGKSDKINMKKMYDSNDTPLCCSFKYLNVTEFDNILELLTKANRSSDWYADITYSLRCMADENFLDKFMSTLIPNGETELDTDSIMFLFYIFKKNLSARSKVLDFIESHHKRLCQSTVFLENFNRFSEFIATPYREKFLNIRDLVVQEIKLNKQDFNIVSANSDRIGMEMERSEVFAKQFGNEIYTWLSEYFNQPENDIINAKILRRLRYFSNYKLRNLF